MSKNADQHTPHDDGKWKFDKSVTDNFDAMLENSIPAYAEMRRLTNGLVRHFADDYHKVVVDIGASRGGAISELAQTMERTMFHALEISEPMLEVLRKKFDTNPRVTVHEYDLRRIEAFGPFAKHSNTVVLSSLTLQFVPIEHRQRIVQRIYDSLTVGGAFILIEKVLGNSSALDDLMVDEYYRMKNANGYSYEDIQRKRAALEGVLVPITEEWNVSMLRNAGFSQIDCYWRHLNFCGLIAVK